MKAGWTNKNLSDVCTVFADGDWIESKDQSTGGIRLIQTGNVGKGAFKDRGDKARYISEDTFARLRCTEIFEGDCLISRLPDPVGRSAIMPDTGERMITAVDCTIVRFNQELCLPSFFNYYSQSSEYIINVGERCTGTTRNRISRSQLGNTPIPAPAIEEQRRIVSLLDEAYDCIATATANAEMNLLHARELFASHLHAVFSLDVEGRYVKRIGDVCNLLNGFAFKNGDAVTESQTQLVRMGNLYGNALNLDRSPIFYPDSFAEEYERYLLKEGDLIMSLTGTTGKEDYGYAVRILDPGHQLLMNQRIAKFDLINMDVVTSDYLFYYLRSRVFLDILYPTANGTRQANLSSVAIKTLPIPLCSIPEQKRKVRALGEVANESQRLESIYQQKLAALDELKKSLLHRAFNGDL